MTEISQIKLPNGKTYDIKDRVARGVVDNHLYFTGSNIDDIANYINSDKNYRFFIKDVASSTVSNLPVPFLCSGVDWEVWEEDYKTPGSTSVSYRCVYARASLTVPELYIDDTVNMLFMKKNTAVNRWSIVEGRANLGTISISSTGTATYIEPNNNYIKAFNKALYDNKSKFFSSDYPSRIAIKTDYNNSAVDWANAVNTNGNYMMFTVACGISSVKKAYIVSFKYNATTPSSSTITMYQIK